MLADSDYRPPFWYRGRHLQTLWGPLLRNWRRPPLRRERLHTPDGDFLDLDWLADGPERGPLILILHGLEGSARSHYARGLLRGAGALGWRAAISTPFDLAACARELDRGFNRAIYTESFLRTMKAKIRAKRHLYDDRLDVAAALRARTFTEYDRFFTAPINGFADEHDYWARASSAPYLERIRRPTLLINAINDPFMPAACLPTAVVEGSRWLEAAFVAEGGHVGFLDGPLGGASWAERRALAFLARHLLR